MEREARTQNLRLRSTEDDHTSHINLNPKTEPNNKNPKINHENSINGFKMCGLPNHQKIKQEKIKNPDQKKRSKRRQKNKKRKLQPGQLRQPDHFDSNTNINSSHQVGEGDNYIYQGRQGDIYNHSMERRGGTF